MSTTIAISTTAVPLNDESVEDIREEASLASTGSVESVPAAAPAPVPATPTGSSGKTGGRDAPSWTDPSVQVVTNGAPAQNGQTPQTRFVTKDDAATPLSSTAAQNRAATAGPHAATGEADSTTTELLPTIGTGRPVPLSSTRCLWTRCPQSPLMATTSPSTEAPPIEAATVAPKVSDLRNRDLAVANFPSAMDASAACSTGRHRPRRPSDDCGPGDTKSFSYRHWRGNVTLQPQTCLPREGLRVCLKGHECILSFRGGRHRHDGRGAAP